MALGVRAAVSVIGVPVDCPIGCGLERRTALLVQILAILGFNRGWIDRVFGESEPSRCHAGYRGNHQPVLVQSNCPWAFDDRRSGTWSNSTRRNIVLISSLRQREHREVA